MYIQRSIERHIIAAQNTKTTTTFVALFYTCHILTFVNFFFNFHFRYQEKLCFKKYNFTSCCIIKPENITSRIIKNKSYDAKAIEHLVRIKKYRLKGQGLTEI